MITKVEVSQKNDVGILFICAQNAYQISESLLMFQNIGGHCKPSYKQI